MTVGYVQASNILSMPIRILLVDDELMVRALIARAMREEGYEVIAVKDGEGALDAARAAAPFDLVITNSWMAGHSGVDAILKLREVFPGTPILHVDDLPPSRRSSSGQLPELRTIFKPFSISGLKQVVRELLGPRPE